MRRGADARERGGAARTGFLADRFLFRNTPEGRLSITPCDPSSLPLFRRELMRKLPETGLQFIREFKEKEGAFVAFAVFGFAPDDEAINGHPAEATLRVHLDEQHGNLGADGKLPSRVEAHSAL